ncbi:MAG: hypothetical protein NVS2B8_03200 [Vulcanimicrobiaceae bacterium]
MPQVVETIEIAVVNTREEAETVRAASAVAAPPTGANNADAERSRIRIVQLLQLQHHGRHADDMSSRGGRAWSFEHVVEATKVTETTV